MLQLEDADHSMNKENCKGTEAQYAAGILNATKVLPPKMPELIRLNAKKKYACFEQTYNIACHNPCRAGSSCLNDERNKEEHGMNN